MFRGKRVSDGKWVEGDLNRCVVVGETYIRRIEENLSTTIHKIDPETVCQYTGKPDDNGNKIWEEDFVKINDEWIGRVVWRDDVTAFCVFPNDDIEHETYCLGFYIEEGYKVEVIGNIFDNPELIEENT